MHSYNKMNFRRISWLPTQHITPSEMRTQTWNSKMQLSSDCSEWSSLQNFAERQAVVWIFYDMGSHTHIHTHSKESLSSLVRQQSSAVYQVLERWTKRTRIWSEESLRLPIQPPCSVKLSYCSLSWREKRSPADTLQRGNNNNSSNRHTDSNYAVHILNFLAGWLTLLSQNAMNKGNGPAAHSWRIKSTNCGQEHLWKQTLKCQSGFLEDYFPFFFLLDT